MITISFALIAFSSWKLALLLRGALVAAITNTTAKVLYRSEPGHHLHWLAFVRFIIGFGLDLLASQARTPASSPVLILPPKGLSPKGKHRWVPTDGA